MAGLLMLPPLTQEFKVNVEQFAPVYTAKPISVSVPGEVIKVKAPPAGTTAVNQISPSLLPPSHATSGTDEFVAPEFEPPTGVQLVPTVRVVAVHGSSFGRPKAMHSIVALNVKSDINTGRNFIIIYKAVYFSHYAKITKKSLPKGGFYLYFLTIIS